MKRLFFNHLPSTNITSKEKWYEGVVFYTTGKLYEFYVGKEAYFSINALSKFKVVFQNSYLKDEFWLDPIFPVKY